MPKKEHVEWLLKGEHIGDIITNQYDLVCNGLEVGGGSIRAHKSEILKAVFKVMGYNDERIEAEFGHMLQAFRYGAPPHGGIAHGVERNLMNLWEKRISAKCRHSANRFRENVGYGCAGTVDKKSLDDWVLR